MKEYYSKNGIRVRDSRIEDVYSLANTMRESDREEIWASHHKHPFEALKTGFDQSIICLTIENGSPIVMFGVTKENLLSDKGVIWMLASDDMNKIRFIIARHSKKFIDLMLNVCGYLENYVHIKNQESIKWLRMCGAHFEDAKIYGIEKQLFYHFYFRR